MPLRVSAPRASVPRRARPRGRGPRRRSPGPGPMPGAGGRSRTPRRRGWHPPPSAHDLLHRRPVPRGRRPRSPPVPCSPGSRSQARSPPREGRQRTRTPAPRGARPARREKAAGDSRRSLGPRGPPRTEGRRPGTTGARPGSSRPPQSRRYERVRAGGHCTRRPVEDRALALGNHGTTVDGRTSHEPMTRSARRPDNRLVLLVRPGRLGRVVQVGRVVQWFRSPGALNPAPTRTAPAGSVPPTRWVACSTARVGWRSGRRRPRPPRWPRSQM